MSTRKPSVRYHGHGRFTVPDIARSPDGRYIASDALDVQMWEAATGRLRLTYRPGASAEFFQIALAPDGTRLAVGSSDMTVQVFQGL